MTAEQVTPKKNIHHLTVDTPGATCAFAAQFAGTLLPGDVIALYGDLGAGKTFFVKCACRALGLRDEATSPTFSIVNEYHGSQGQQVYHFDFYRIEHVAEMVNLGLDEYFYSEAICFIEWPEILADMLPSRRVEVHIDPVTGAPDSRSIRVYTVG